MRINVTAEHIEKGLDTAIFKSLCPTALAIKEATKQTDVKVGYNHVLINDKEYKLPLIATYAISAFTASSTYPNIQKILQPFSFELDYEAPRTLLEVIKMGQAAYLTNRYRVSQEVQAISDAILEHFTVTPK